MKIHRVEAQNYLGARAVNLALSAPVLLVAGKNGAGKSSIQEAVRHALAGDAARVSLKKEFRALITEGADAGYATVATDDGECSIVLPSGKGVHAADHPAKEAQAKARDAKTAWKATTGGETWGKDKAAGWAAPKPAETYSVEQVRAAEDLLKETDAEIEATNQQIGERRAAAKQRADAEARVSDLRAKAGRLPALREKLARDEADHAEWSAKLAALPPAPGEKPRTFACPCCGVALVHRLADGALIEYQTDTKKADPEIEVQRKQQQDAVDLYARSVANDRRDIATAEAAAAELASAEKILSDTAPGYAEAAEAKLAELKADRKARNDTLQAMCAANKAAHDADALTKKAAAHHADVLAWLVIADALAPDGIPAELLAAALQPINDCMAAGAIDAEWAPIRIADDMEIVQVLDSTNHRPYRLLSESEQWRADALIGAAIAELSGLRLLMLDRFDVLDAKGREDALFWLDGMAQDGKVDTAIVSGTLKSLPSGLPDSIQPVWIENGTAGELQEAA